MSASTSARIRRRRIQLFEEQEGLCWWCKVPMLLLPPMDKRKNMPKETCTLDHLFDRYHPERRRRPRPGERRYVAACLECNHRRGGESTAKISKRTLRRRAQNGRSSGPERVAYSTQQPAGATIADVWPYKPTTAVSSRDAE